MIAGVFARSSAVSPRNTLALSAPASISALTTAACPYYRNQRSGPKTMKPPVASRIAKVRPRVLYLDPTGGGTSAGLGVLGNELQTADSRQKTHGTAHDLTSRPQAGRPSPSPPFAVPFCSPRLAASCDCAFCSASCCARSSRRQSGSQTRPPRVRDR